jgi:hypothetical protein
MPISRVPPCACFCARGGHACARTAQVRALRRGSLHPPLLLQPQCPPAISLRRHRRLVRAIAPHCACPIPIAG